jgi:hypothetical protein
MDGLKNSKVDVQAHKKKAFTIHSNTQEKTCKKEEGKQESHKAEAHFFASPSTFSPPCMCIHTHTYASSLPLSFPPPPPSSPSATFPPPPNIPPPLPPPKSSKNDHHLRNQRQTHCRPRTQIRATTHHGRCPRLAHYLPKNASEMAVLNDQPANQRERKVIIKQKAQTAMQSAPGKSYAWTISWAMQGWFCV